MDHDRQRYDDIREIVLEVLELDANEITPTSRFKEDHDADSLLAIEILARIERQLKVQIPQSELAKMTHLEGVYAVVDQYMERPSV